MSADIIRLPRVIEEKQTPVTDLQPYFSADQVRKNLLYFERLLATGLLEPRYASQIQSLHTFYSTPFPHFENDLRKISSAQSINTTLSRELPVVGEPNPSSLRRKDFQEYISQTTQNNGDIILVAHSHSLLYPVTQEAQQQLNQKVKVTIIDRHVDTYPAMTPDEWRSKHPGETYMPGKANVSSAVLEDNLVRSMAIFGLSSRSIEGIYASKKSSGRRGPRPEDLRLIDPREYTDIHGYNASKLHTLVGQMVQQDVEEGITNHYLSIDLDGIYLPDPLSAIDYISYAPLLAFSLFDVSLVEQEVLDYLSKMRHGYKHVDFTNEEHVNLVAESLAREFNALGFHPEHMLRNDIPHNDAILKPLKLFVEREGAINAGLSWEVFVDLVREMKIGYKKAGIEFGLSLANGKKIVAEITEADGPDVDGRTAKLIKMIVDLLEEPLA